MQKMPEFPPIKFDLQTRSGTIYGEEERKAMLECLDRDAPTSDKKVEEFEREFAKLCGTKYAITCANGTAALMIAYKSLGIGPGDEIITTPLTWIATPAAAEVLGAKIIFCDVNSNTLNMDPTKLKSLITPKTKAICPVHLYGQPVEFDQFSEICAPRHIPIIEDSAHAPGGRYHGKMTGNLGDLGCFSFHEQKNMSTLGEGGMVTTNSEKLYELCRSYKSHCARVIGKSTKYLTLSDEISQKALAEGQFWFQDFDDCGFNFRMNDMSATVGLCQLKKIDQMNNRRNEIASYLTTNLSKIPGITPNSSIPNIFHTYHLYPVFIESKKISRDQFIFQLRMKYGVKVGVHYMPLVQTQAFKNRKFNEKIVPVACARWKSVATLPIHPRMKNEHLDYMLDSIKSLLI